MDVRLKNPDLWLIFQNEQAGSRAKAVRGLNRLGEEGAIAQQLDEDTFCIRAAQHVTQVYAEEQIQLAMSAGDSDAQQTVGVNPRYL